MLNNGSKKVLILGYSLTGKKSAEYFLKKGYSVYISEFSSMNKKDEDDVKKLINLGAKIEFNGHSDEFINNSDFVIISPSIKDDAPVIKKINSLNIPIYSDIEYAGINLNYQDKMILITGTNGKTTTTMLTSFILSEKYNAPYVGNVGVPPLEVLEDENNLPDYLCVEASSYQLHYSKKLMPKISILCNITPDHISWHNGMEGYIKDKTDILKRADKNSYVILNYDDPYTKTFESYIKANIYYFSLSKIDYENNCYIKDNSIYFKNEKIIDTDEINMAGNHNMQNVMCAIIAAKLIGLDNETVKGAIKKLVSSDLVFFACKNEQRAKSLISIIKDTKDIEGISKITNLQRKKAIELLVYGTVDFNRTTEGLVINLPDKPLNRIAPVFKVE